MASARIASWWALEPASCRRMHLRRFKASVRDAISISSSRLIFSGSAPPKAPANPLTEMPIFCQAAPSRPRSSHTPYHRLKRLFDAVAALILILWLLPLLMLAAILVFLDVGSPVLFWQQRAGQGGRELQLYKLRTLRPPFDRQRPKDTRGTTGLVDRSAAPPDTDRRAAAIAERARRRHVLDRAQAAPAARPASELHLAADGPSRHHRLGSGKRGHQPVADGEGSARHLVHPQRLFVARPAHHRDDGSCLAEGRAAIRESAGASAVVSQAAEAGRSEQGLRQAAASWFATAAAVAPRGRRPGFRHAGPGNAFVALSPGKPDPSWDRRGTALASSRQARVRGQTLASGRSASAHPNRDAARHIYQPLLFPGPFRDQPNSDRSGVPFGRRRDRCARRDKPTAL